MRSNKEWRTLVATLLLMLCALNSAPWAAAQVSCTVTYTCPPGSGGARGCAGLMGGAVTHRTLSFASNADCVSQAAKVNSGIITTCSCPGGGPAPGSVPAAPAAPGHEFDDTIKQAISAGVAGKISPGNAVGFVSLGLLGNALFAPKTVDPAQQQQQQAQAQNNLAAQQLYNSGIYLLRHGNYAGAINEFQQALAKTPNDANILHSLEMARQKLKDTAKAGQTSGALGQFLGTAPAGIGISNSALNLVNVDSDPNEVDLRGTTRTSPESLKGELDGVFGGNASAAPSSPQAVQPQGQDQNKDIDQLFQPPQPTSAQSASAQPAHPDATQKEADQKQVEDIFKDPKDSTEPDPSIRDAVADSHSDPNAAPSTASNPAGNRAQGTAGTATGLFGATNANPSASPFPMDQQTVKTPGPGTDVNASHQMSATAGGSIRALGLGSEAGSRAAGQPFDSGGSRSDGDAAPVVTVSTPTAAPISYGAAALAAHIPDAAKSDPAIQNDMAFYQKLDRQKIDTQAKLAALQLQIDSGTGDAQVLSAQKTTLTNNLNQYKTDQANTQVQIKQIVVGHNLPWIEDAPAPSPPTPANSSTPATQ